MSGTLALALSLFGLAAIARGQPYSEYELVSSSSLIQTSVDASDLTGALSRGGKYEMSMTNHDAMSYTIGTTIAGQSIEGIFDTGSDQLVTFQKHGCVGCGGAAALVCQEPACTKKGKQEHIKYGSGDVWVNLVTADVSVGQLTASSLTLALAYKAKAKILKEDPVHAIIGTCRDGKLAQGLGVQSFSVCLPIRGAGRLVWNDDIGGGFSSPALTGSYYWMSGVSGAKLDGPKGSISLGGSLAILDTGTSLLALPKSTIEAMEMHLNSVEANCDDVDTLPVIKFQFGGVSYELPPSAYLGWDGMDCVIIVTDSTEDIGDNWILGMPFFSSYYTNFNIGGSVHTAPATGGCKPGTRTNGSSASRAPLRTVDPRSVILPKGGRFYSRDGPANAGRKEGRIGVISAPP